MNHGALIAIFCIAFLLIGIAHIAVPQVAKAFWLICFFPLGLDRDDDESVLGYRLIGVFFILIGGIIAFYAIRG